MRTLSDTLNTAQKASTLIPYIRLVFTKGGTTYDYTSRLKRLVHVEEPYNSYAQIWLDNSDRAVADITGFYVDVGYGLTTGAGDEYSSASRLWVVQMSEESEPGRLEAVLYLEGIWRILREIQDIGGIGATGPYMDVEYDGTLDDVYDILEDILELCANTDLDPIGSVDDGIITTYQPAFSINSLPFEDAASLVYRLTNMTMCYLRPKGDYAGTNMAGFTVVHPQTSDAVDYSYYSDIADGHVFYQCFWKTNVVTPNKIYAFCNQSADGTWGSIITGSYDGSANNPIYDENGVALVVPEYHLAADITTQAQADLRAEAIYWKLWHEVEWGVVVVPHNCGQELYDYVKVYDSR